MAKMTLAQFGLIFKQFFWPQGLYYSQALTLH